MQERGRKKKTRNFIQIGKTKGAAAVEETTKLVKNMDAVKTNYVARNVWPKERIVVDLFSHQKRNFLELALTGKNVLFGDNFFAILN